MQIRIILAEENLLNTPLKPEDGDIIVNSKYAYMTKNTFDTLQNIKWFGNAKLELKRNIANILTVTENKITTELEIIVYEPKINDMKNDNVVNTTKEKVLTAYKEGNEETKKSLKNLFPKVFEDNQYFDLQTLCNNWDPPIIFDTAKSCKAGFYGNNFMQIRNAGEYDNRAFYLSGEYDWELKHDTSQQLCLIPTKKQGNQNASIKTN